MTFAFLLASGLLLPQPQPDQLRERIAELLVDLSDASASRGALLELEALAPTSGDVLAELLLVGSQHADLFVTSLRGQEPGARALVRAVVRRVAELPAPEQRTPAQVHAAARAAQIAAVLAPHLRDGNSLCAPLRNEPDAGLLLGRLEFAKSATPLALRRALVRESVLEAELAAEILALRAEPASPELEADLLQAWEQRGAWYRDDDFRYQGGDANDAIGSLGLALRRCLPAERLPAGVYETRFWATLPHEAVAALEWLGEQGPAAAAWLPELRGGLFHFDDCLGRTALRAAARLGVVALPLLDDVRQRAEVSPDPETRRLAAIAVRRITAPADASGYAADLVEDLDHPAEGERALRELQRLGEVATAALWRALGNPAQARLRVLLEEQLATWPEPTQVAAVRMFATAPTDALEATWLRLRLAVDLVADTPDAVAARAALQSWDGANPRLSRALLARLDLLEELPASSDGAALRAALGRKEPALVARAVALLARVGPLAEAHAAALTAVLQRDASWVDGEDSALHLGAEPRPATARLLLQRASAPPPEAFRIAAAAAAPAAKLALLRRLSGFGWPPATRVALLTPWLADTEPDEVRVAALAALGACRGAELPPEVARLAEIRHHRGLAGAARRALAAQRR
jgi:hypothetical protein